MAEFTAISTQTVAAGGNALLTETPVRGTGCVNHREGSGIVTLRGQTGQCRALYRVSYNGNIAVADGGTAGAISVALALEGEALPSTLAIVTPAAVGDFFHVSGDVFIPVSRGCCATVAVRNTSAQPIDVANLNVIVERVA